MVTEETQKVLRNFKRFDEKKFWRKKYLTPEQCAALLHAAKEVDEHLYCAVIIAIYTGLRQCDILNLRWSNIGLDARETSLVMRKTSEPLVLPIPQTLHRYLSEQCTDKSASSYLITWRGKQIKSVRKSFAHACRIAGIEGLRCAQTYKRSLRRFPKKVVDGGRRFVVSNADLLDGQYREGRLPTAQ